MTPFQLAVKASEHFQKEGEDLGSEMEAAIVFGFSDEGISVIASSKDIYQAIEDAESSPVSFHAVGIVSSGWAAPLSEDGECEGMPSEHAKRRRVRLYSVHTPASSSSYIVFSDGETLGDEDTEDGTGPLADALGYLAQRLCK